MDANGAYTPAQALKTAEYLREAGVSWFEEPVPYRDCEGTRWVREHAPAGMQIAGGEYGYTLQDFRAILESGSVDVLQADATRCGITGFLQVAALCEAFGVPLSSHTAPSLHLPICLSAPAMIHMEYFHDHARIEEHLFEGAQKPKQGLLRFDSAKPGLGLTLRENAAQAFRLQ